MAAALLSDAPGEQVTVGVSPSVMAVDYLGAAVDLDPPDQSADFALTVREVDGPVFIFFQAYTV